MTTAAVQRIMDIAETLPNEAEEPIINFMIKLKSPEKPMRTDIADSGLDFAPEFTDENHDERMNQFFSLSEGIEIDEQAIADLRKASMI